MNWEELTRLVYDKSKHHGTCKHNSAFNIILKYDYYFTDIFYWTSYGDSISYIVLDCALKYLNYDINDVNIIRELVETKEKSNLIIAKELFVQSYNKVNVSKEIKQETKE